MRSRLDRRSLGLMLVLLATIIMVALLRDVTEPRRFHVPAPFPSSRARGGTGVLASFERAIRFSQLVLPLRARGYVTVVRSLAGITTISGLGLIMLLLMGQRIERMARILRQHLGNSFLLGVALVVGTSLLGLLAIISLVAVPVVPVIGLGLSLAGTLGVLVVAVAVGQQCRALVGGEPNAVADLLTGVLLLALGLVLPLIGSPLLLLTVLWGIGAVALSRGGSL